MNNQQSNRYSRQIRLGQIGESGQQKILDSTVLIIGMGGLGDVYKRQKLSNSIL